MYKITFFIEDLQGGGAERVLTNLINYYQDCGKYQVSLICVVDKQKAYNLPDSVKVTYLIKNLYFYNKISKFFLIPLIAKRLASLVKKENIATINSHTFFPNYVAVYTKIKYVNHLKVVATTANSIYSLSRRHWFIKKLHLTFIKKYYPLSDIHLFKSKQMQTEFSNYCGDNQLITIYNPVHLKSIDFVAKPIIANHKFTIVTVGRLIALKRFKDLILALKKINLDIFWQVLGDGPLKSELEGLTKQYHLADRVQFLGFQQNPYQIIKEADCLVSCSAAEGFPNNIVEAMACGVPVIAADCYTGPREILAPNTDFSIQLKEQIEITKYGILYPVGIIEKLQEAILFMVRNDAQRRQFASNCLNRIDSFAIEKIATQYAKVISY